MMNDNLLDTASLDESGNLLFGVTAIILLLIN